MNIKNITKEYGDFKAIDNFSFDLFPGEIFCLLGHNGAGKTTLIKIISGIEEPNEGDILLNGISILNDKNNLYKNIGVCDQEDILFDYLTVEEHINYFLKLRGENINNDKIQCFINNLKLNEHMKDKCDKLPKGIKRKLCIILSLIGNNKIILLDEPTSGLDSVSRRELWKFLKENKEDKIIILTTHSLEEAEFLGDRIGIIKEGKLVCSGTSSYLKNKYPNGFNINFIINNRFDEENRQQLITELKEIEPTLFIKIYSNKILTINFNTSNKDKINNIFELIEESKIKYSLDKYTISTTSLEDVFINLNNEEISNRFNINENNENRIVEKENIDNENNNTNYSVPFTNQLNFNIKRNLLSLLSNKNQNITLFLIVLIPFLFYLPSLIAKDNKEFEVIKNKINIYTNNKDYIINSKYYKKLENEIQTEWNNKIDFENIYSFRNYIFDNSKLENNAILFKRNKENNEIETYILYLENNPEYFQAIMNILINIISEKTLKIIVDSFKQFYVRKVIKTLNINFIDFYIFFILECILLFGAYSLNNSVKEKLSNIKYILYLNGNNKLSYWIGLFFSDFIKILIIEIIFFILFIWINLNENDKLLLLLFFLALISICLLAYFFSLIFNQNSTILFILYGHCFFFFFFYLFL